MTEPVVVADYDPEWPRQFARLRDRALRALGGLDARVEHVGSTAVPGLAAKPVIDLDVVVRSAGDVPRAIERLAAAGYAHQGDKGVPGREAFRWPAGEERHHLYVVVDGSPAYRRHTLMRDYLRSRPDAAEEYGRLKRELAVRFRDDRVGYTEAKDAFTDTIMAAAEREEEHARRRTARQLGLIAEIASLAASAGVEWWLRGGWALDFRVGSVTRPHRDVDLFVLEADADRFGELLARAGYACVAGPPPRWQRNFRKDGEDLHAALIARDERGRPVTPGVAHEDFSWPQGILDAAPGRIGDAVAPALSLEGLLWAKETAPGLLGRPQRPFDSSDLERLRKALRARGPTDRR